MKNREDRPIMGTAGERKTKRQKRREQRAEEDETRDNDGSFSGKLNLSRCYWEENGIEEQQGGSEGDDGGPEAAVRSQKGEDGEQDKLHRPFWPLTDNNWGVKPSPLPHCSGCASRCDREEVTLT